MSFHRQAGELQRGIDVLVATPGRLADHLDQGTCVLDDIAITAIDEADRMAGWASCPRSGASDGHRPTGSGSFSATLDGDVRTLVQRYLTDPVTPSITRPPRLSTRWSTTCRTSTRWPRTGSWRDRRPRVARSLSSGRSTAPTVWSKQLRRDGIAAGALHGGKAQNARNRAIAAFRDGSLRCSSPPTSRRAASTSTT
jgi:superfamily II DNA/RNA helicase